MSTHNLWSQILIGVGGVTMVVGVVDPIEGSLLVLLGCGLVTLALFIRPTEAALRRYWVATWAMIVWGVTAMIVLSVLGGIGGESGRSIWWGIFIVPYPLGWVMGMASLIRMLDKHRQPMSPSGHAG